MDHINTFQTNQKMSTCALAPAYASLCRGLEYLVKIRYIILANYNGARFFIFETVSLGRTATLSYVWKIHHKNWRHLRLIAHRFTKLSHNVCLVNTHNLIYRYARCDCKLRNVLWFYCVFLGIFIHYWRPLMSEVLYLYQIFTDCMSYQYLHFDMLICQI